MAKPVEIVVWFDDGTRYHIDPAAAGSLFTTQGAAAKCGHHGPFDPPGQDGPVKGPFPGNPGPPPKDTAGGGKAGNVSAQSGSCYYVNGMIVCP